LFAYYAVRLLLLPGIVLHELSHYYFCRMVGAEIHEVCFFSFGYPAGYVIHTAPKKFRAHVAIVMGPLLINSIVAVVLFCAAIGTWHELVVLDPYDWPGPLLRLVAAGWLGLVAALQALPSSGDAISLWQVAKWHGRNGNPLALVSYPVALTIQLTNWLRAVWVDWLFTAGLIWCAFRLVQLR
jgi:hypothetical protein